MKIINTQVIPRSRLAAALLATSLLASGPALALDDAPSFDTVSHSSVVLPQTEPSIAPIVAPASAAAGYSNSSTSSKQSAAENDGYVARKDGLRTFFNALSARLNKPIVVSQKASRKQISGDFDLAQPQRLLERIATELGLIWYHDGQTIHVYDASEMRNTLIALPNTTLATLNAFLRKAGLFDRRYPLRGASGVFYIAGPPIYVELLQSAASFLQRQTTSDALGGLRIEVVRLENTFVTDRNLTIRDRDVVVPGMATVIEQLLRGEQMPVEMKIEDQLPAADAGAGPASSMAQSTLVASATPLFAALAGVPAMPPLNAADSGFGPASSAASAAAMVALPPTRSELAGKIRVIAYRDTNSLLIKGSEEQVAFVKHLIAKLDVPKRHVELSLWIIDLAKTDLDQLGVSWKGGLSVGNKVGVNFNNAVSTLDGGRFVASIMAMQENQQTRIVSRPVVLTQENVPALFDNNSTFYTKIEGERIASLEKVTFGTMINVLPRFAENGQIEMSLTIEDGNEVASGGTSGIVLPRVSRTHISTIARVPKGMSLLIGGYTRDQNTDTVEKVPFLGDLPGIGALFRTRVNRESNMVRVFLIQPREIEDALRPDASDLVDNLLSDVERDPQQQQLRDYMDRKDGN